MKYSPGVAETQPVVPLIIFSVVIVKMDSSEARQVLNIEGDFSAIELKKAFRTCSFICHPDAGGSVDEFQRLQDAHKVLQPQASEREGIQGLSTVEGRAFSDLGHGYPLTESARPCDDCDGHGYRKMHEPTGHEEAECGDCGGTGLMRYACNRCRGTGDYKHPGTGKVVGECYGCKGTGWFYPERKRDAHKGFGFDSFWGAFNVKYIPGTRKIGQNCKKCLGTGIVDTPIGERTFYIVCPACDGVGEIKMWNAVLPRGLFTARGS